LLLRVDENDKCEHISYDILENTEWEKYDAVVISDYCKGFLYEDDIEYISLKHPLTFLDSKKILGDWASNISFIKINSNEYEKTKHILDHNKILFNKTIITRGKYGCNYQNINYPTQEVPVKDVSGAGDTFLAGLVVEYVKSKNIELAINFAQECTTVVVQKSGVSTI
jgi:bifunctional ADP-heptose synthase (sugar kinase/adenylyltransferase)